jgi:adenylyl cyclase-associated protein
LSTEQYFRLEAATSRLEDVALYNAASQPQRSVPAESEQSDDLPRSVRAFDEALINARVKPWVELSQQLGGPVDEQAKLVLAQFNTLRQILLVASKCQKPDQASLFELLRPLQKDTEAVTTVKDQNWSSKDLFNHLATVAEGSSCVGWITLVRFVLLDVDYSMISSFRTPNLHHS